MEGSTDERLVRDAGGDRIVDLAGHRRVTTDVEVQAATRVEAPPAGLDVRRVDHPLGVVLTLAGELDLATVPVLREWLDQVCAKVAVIIDLSRVRFIDSSGLDLLVRAERHLRDSGAQLVLVRGPRAVHRVFELTSLDSHFEFCDSPSATSRAELVRRIESRRIPRPPQADSTAAELDRDLGGVTSS
ncbi:MAG TPA: STAS domain-containing protein [Solirubrobacteraceae bacterium]|nr:STAS domain-containing protein [Solirubrobacteraceae bacterium]